MEMWISYLPEQLQKASFIPEIYFPIRTQEVLLLKKQKKTTKQKQDARQIRSAFSLPKALGTQCLNSTSATKTGLLLLLLLVFPHSC